MNIAFQFNPTRKHVKRFAITAVIVAQLLIDIHAFDTRRIASAALNESNKLATAAWDAEHPAQPTQ
jgi:hypothetical protein